MSDNVLVVAHRDPLFGLSKEGYVQKLRERLSGRVRAAYIFGSFTGDSFGRLSDVDIILIAETTRPFIERAFDFEDLLDIVPSTDILVYTVDEFRSIMENAETGFWKSVRDGMVKIVG